MAEINDRRDFLKNEAFLMEMCQDVINLATNGVFLASVDGKIKEVNLSGCDMFGYTHDELLNMSITDLITIENLQQYPLSLDNLPIGDKNVRDRQLRRKDGSVFVAEIHGQKLSNGLVLGILHEKTEHTSIKEALKLAENLIRESEEKYRLLYEFAGVGIGYYTPQGMIISYNELAAKNLNSKPEDVAGKSLYEIFPKDAADSYLNRIEKAANSKSSQRYEDEVHLPTGRKWFDSTYTGIRNSVGEVIGVQILSIDITDRKLVEATLRESEERYCLLYQRSPMGYQSLDTDGNIIEVNQAWLNTLGYAREEVIGHWFGEFLVPEMVEAFRERFPKFKADGEVHNQFAMVHKNGQIITVAFDGKIGHDQAGNFKQTHCVLRDITEQQRLQDALRDSEERYRTVADYAMDWETWIDPEGKYQYCSPSCEQITGYPPEKFIETPEFILSLVHPDDREIMEEHFAEEKADRPESTIIYRIHRNDGQVRWIEHNCRSVFSKGGSFLGVRGNDRDVTNRKLAEKALYESEARYRRLTDHAPDIIFRYDLNPIQKLVYINPAVQTITGYSPAECYADPALMLNMVHPDDRSQMDAMLADLNVPEEGFTMRWIGKDGVTRWMESRIVPVRDEAGQLLAVEGITRDLTDRITTDNALKTSEHFLVRAQKIAKLGNWTRDLVTGISTWSDGLYAIYGRERQEDDDVLKLWWETVHPDDKSHTVDLEKRFLAGESDYDTEYRIIRQDNHEVRIIHATAELIRDDQGVPVQVVGVAQDITERIHAENALRVSEQSLARSQKIAGMGSWNCNYEIGSFTWSDSLYDIYGRQKKENDNIHEMWLETVHPDDKQRMIDLDKKFIAGESEYDTECRIIRQDNHEVRIVHAIAEMVRDDKGTPLRSIGVAQDITERKRAEEELKESELRFRTLFEHAAVGVALLDTKTGCFIDINQKYCDFVGYTRTEMLDLAFQDVTYPQDIDENIENTKLLLAGEIREFAVEKRYVRKDGKIAWGTLTASPLWAPGETPPVYLHIAIVQDITERKQVEEALRKSEASLNQAQKIANVGNWSWHLSSDQYEGSDQFYTIYGINRDGASSVWHETVSQSVHSDDIALIEAADKIVMSGSIPKPIEYRVVWPDGSTHIVSDEVGEIILDEDGKPSIVTGIVQDITERKEAEKALRESERVLASAQKIAHLGSWDWNPQTNEVYWSDELYEIYGREKTDGPPLMDGWLDAVYPEDRNRLSRHIEDALAGKSPYDIEYRIFREDTQEERTIHAMGEVVWDKNDVPIRLLGSVQDITESKQAENLVRESEEKFRYVFEAANVGKAITSISGGMLVNKAFANMLGYSPEELAPKTWQMITPLEEIEPNEGVLAPMLEGKIDAVRFDKHYIHKNGTYIWADVSVAMQRDANGNPMNYIANIINITERKRAEEALKQKLDELMRFQRLVVGRELRMIELKKEINELLDQVGKTPKYQIASELNDEP